MWVCSYGVVNCRICMRPIDDENSLRAKSTGRAIEAVSKALVGGSVRAKVGSKGDISFSGLTDADRGGLTDVEIYRNLIVNGSSLVRAKLSYAELVAGRAVNSKTIGHVGVSGPVFQAQAVESANAV